MPAGAAIDATTGNDSASSDAATRVAVVDSAAILDVKSKHVIADQLESDLKFALAQIVAVSDHLKHAAAALFDQLHSHIDNEAAK